MHTSAQLNNQRNLRAFVWEGTLLHRAEARTKVLDGQNHAIPVVCMDVELDNAMHTHMHVERPYPMGEHKQAEADAACLKKGTRVAIEAPAIDLRLVARNATTVTTLPAAEAAPSTTDHTNDLFQEQAA